MKYNYGNLLVNQNPHSPDYEKALALHWVIGNGTKHNRHDAFSVEPFGSADLAKIYCDYCNWLNNGIDYYIVSDVRQLEVICNSFDIPITHYLFVQYEYSQSFVVHFLIVYYSLFIFPNANGLADFYLKHNGIDLNDYLNKEL